MVMKAAEIDALKPREKTSYEVRVGGVTGLCVIVSPGGARSYAIKYKFQGKYRKLWIGQASIGLAEAKRRAGVARGLIDKGIDPVGEKQAKRIAAKQAVKDGVETAVADFIAMHIERKNKLSTATEYKRLFARQILPAWKGKRLSEITKRDVNELINKLAIGAPIGANRTLALLKRFFRWAIAQDIIQHSPCDGVEKPSSETKRDRELNERELRIVWAACDKIGWPYRDIVRLLILTGARRGEIVGMRWSEIVGDVWTIPRERSKNRRAHIVPLAPAVVEILTAMPRFESDFVFPTHDGKSSVSNYGWNKRQLDSAIAEIIEGDAPLAQWRFHDLRHSFVSGLARLGVPLHVCERCVNHISGSFGGIVGVYQHHKYSNEMVAAFEAWAAHIVPQGVVPMARKQ